MVKDAARNLLAALHSGGGELEAELERTARVCGGAGRCERAELLAAVVEDMRAGLAAPDPIAAVVHERLLGHLARGRERGHERRRGA